jgi:GT2 family glycosyltransferase
MIEYTPIILFVYNRPKHTKMVLDALSKNPEARYSFLYIYCDGPKKNLTSQENDFIIQTRKIIQNEVRFKKVKIVLHDKNKGLANSIIDGVSDVLSKHEKVIVLEDDIVPEKGFLKYMNDALNLYENYSIIVKDTNKIRFDKKLLLT